MRVVRVVRVVCRCYGCYGCYAQEAQVVHLRRSCRSFIWWGWVREVGERVGKRRMIPHLAILI